LTYRVETRRMLVANPKRNRMPSVNNIEKRVLVQKLEEVIKIP